MGQRIYYAIYKYHYLDGRLGKTEKGGSMKFNKDNNKPLTEYMTLLVLV